MGSAELVINTLEQINVAIVWRVFGLVYALFQNQSCLPNALSAMPC